MRDPAHWDHRYETIGTEPVSWYQDRPATSLELLDRLPVGPDRSVLDVGGGASTFVDHLLQAGFEDVAVLDLSVVASRPCGPGSAMTCPSPGSPSTC